MARKSKHMTRENREVIESGVRNGDSASRIARRISVSASTVTREVRKNRTVREPARNPRARLSVRCARYRDCELVGKACGSCSTSMRRCKDCRTHSCIDSCPEFELRMCSKTERWPYVCPEGCPKRRHCSFPKCSYRADEADASYRERLVSSREGIDVTEEGLAELDSKVTPLVRQGHSFEAICAEEDLPVCARTLYNYQSGGALSCANVELPRKVRVKPRKKSKGKGGAGERVDRTGRKFEDFLALPIDDQARVCQGDSVCGGAHDERDILTLMPVARKFQLYLLKGHGRASETVECLDAVERAMGSREAFERVLGIMLVDRGTEFDDWAGMERSCLEPGSRRCRVFYCDAMESNQKSACERNHEQLRRILPKGRTHMDELSAADVALCCSHVNSYPLASLGGASPIDSLGGLLADDVLDLLGVRRIEPRDVVLRPSLVPHAVDQ